MRKLSLPQYAKDEEDPDGIAIRITAYNRGPDPADLHILPQLFFRNTWSWPKEIPKDRPLMHQSEEGTIKVDHPTLKTHLYCTPSPAPAAPAKGGVVLVDGPSVVPDLLFTENETNFEVRVGKIFSPRTVYSLIGDTRSVFTAGRTVHHTSRTLSTTILSNLIDPPILSRRHRPQRSTTVMLM